MVTSYRVRVMFNGSSNDLVIDDLNYVQAKRKFLFYVSACLEFDDELDVRCINIFRGSNCIKYYQNYSICNNRRNFNGSRKI